MFVTLYNEGLIYKDKRLVNWDPKLLTAISDLEVEQVEVKGNLWHFRYPLADGRHLRASLCRGRGGQPPRLEALGRRAFRLRHARLSVVATTRPETMLGDTGVAVHPDDPRYKPLVGKHVDPAAGRPAHPDRRRRISGPGSGHRRGEDDAGA